MAKSLPKAFELAAAFRPKGPASRSRSWSGRISSACWLPGKRPRRNPTVAELNRFQLLRGSAEGLADVDIDVSALEGAQDRVRRDAARVVAGGKMFLGPLPIAAIHVSSRKCQCR